MQRLTYFLELVLGTCSIFSVHAADLPVPPRAAAPNKCATFPIDTKASVPIGAVSAPADGTCKPVMRNGLPLPDPACSPGAVNPTVTLEILTAKGFTTDCLRDKATSSNKKEQTYQLYKIKKPTINTGKNMVCELDHIVSLELGGADTLDNIWPQCGPTRVLLNSRFFKQKDLVENFLAEEVEKKRMDLATAQRGIAEDWTQFLDAAKLAAAEKKKKKPRGTTRRRVG